MSLTLMTGPKKNHVKQVLGSFFNPNISLAVFSDPITSFNTNCVKNPPYDPGTGAGITHFRSPALRAPLTKFITCHKPLRAK